MDARDALAAADPDWSGAPTAASSTLTDPAARPRRSRGGRSSPRAGGEGMVVKPLDFVARGRRGLVQPA